ncbi:arginine--tRNA ligase [Paenibacillus brevis]|uniref:Arginine--tRNA ligase n=1 Tax=Paenibacillus brevis TaxID=2841508 RepID=A0ABS6FUL3_9BACL|nr:arginine--tRNA ligase [Paenibacillus brevis]MBU5673928.1 arginine--tRNA ligase [Paenibacillus brevis]
MKKLQRAVADKLHEWLEGIAAEEILKLMEIPSDASKGDLSLPCFKLSKMLRKAPQEIAAQLADAINGSMDPQSGIAHAESLSGYLNIYLDSKVITPGVLRDILDSGEGYGSHQEGNGKTIVVDFSSPNVAKPFHVGHLRSTVIGGALVRIFKFMGYECIGINHLGDWGTQFGKLVVAYRQWGDPGRLEQGAIDELLRLYVRFHEEAERRPELEDEARAVFARMEQGDSEMLEQWKWFVELSLSEFNRIYELMGTSFDSITGESFYNDKMGRVITELQDRGLLEEDQGAMLVRLDDYNMSPALMLKQDGSSLYHTRDIAAALYRKDTYQFHKAVYVTDYSQSLHFRQWFKVVELMGYPWADQLVHVPFGRVSLEGTGFSTRKGNIVKLEDLLRQTIAKVHEIIEEKNPSLECKDEVARQVGVGAVIFNDLSANRIKDIVFNWEQALSFEGETGPYVQYTYARICSLLRKGRKVSEVFSGSSNLIEELHLPEPEEYALVKQLSLFPQSVESAAAKMEPSIISRYLVDTAQAFNRFYHHCPVMDAERKLRDSRLLLTEGVRITLYNGLKLIGLQAPERM